MKNLLLSIIVLLLAGSPSIHAEEEPVYYYTENCENLEQIDATTWEWGDNTAHWTRSVPAEEITLIDANTIVYEGIEYRTVTHLSRKAFVELCG